MPVGFGAAKILKKSSRPNQRRARIHVPRVTRQKGCTMAAGVVWFGDSGRKPVNFKSRKVAIVGAGAVGSGFAFALA
ncbi:MAG: hypothetical protein WBK37_02715, partial [Kiritimatiellia bacterium]